MSSITTDFALYFEDVETLDFIYNGLKLHNYNDRTTSAEYFKSKSETLSDFLNEASFDFSSFLKDGNLITGMIEGGALTYDSKTFLEAIASLGCNYSIANDYHDRVGEFVSLAYKGSRIVKPATALTALKKISPTIAFKSALVAGKKKLACELLEAGANPDTLIEERPVIEYAAFIEAFNVVKKLVEKGANVNAQSPDKLKIELTDFDYEGGMTALHQVAQRGNLKLLSFLLEHGADHTLQNTEGRTALHCSFCYREPKHAKLLVEKGADTEIKDNNGLTGILSLLSESYGAGKLNTLKFLIEKGADIHATCKFGGNALWYAKEDDPKGELVKYINELGVSKTLVPSNAYIKDAYKNLETAIVHADYDYFTAQNLQQLDDSKQLVQLLISTIYCHQFEMAKILVENGVNPMEREDTRPIDMAERPIDVARSERKTQFLQFFENQCKDEILEENKLKDRVSKKFNEHTQLFRKYTYGKSDELFEELKALFDDSVWLKKDLSPTQIKNSIDYMGRIVSGSKSGKVGFTQQEDGSMEVCITDSLQQVLRLFYKEVGDELIISDIGGR